MQWKDDVPKVDFPGFEMCRTKHLDTSSSAGIHGDNGNRYEGIMEWAVTK